MNDPGMKDQVVVITNASQGWGPTLARAFGSAGAALTLADLEAQTSGALVQDLQADHIPIQAEFLNPCDPTSSRKVARQVVARWGRIDVWINNLPSGSPIPVDEYPAAQFSMLLDHTLTCAYAGAQAAAEVMLPRQQGVILNLGSIYGLRAAAEHVADCTVHAGLIMLTQALGVTWASQGIRVVGIAAGVAHPPAPNQSASPLRPAPIQPPVSGEDIAAAALFLASPAASYITAETLTVDGAWSTYQLF